MTNLDKLKQELKIEDFECGGDYAICNAIHRIRKEGYCNSRNCTECIEWLKQKYNPKILDEKEKEYLGYIIRPFKDRVKSISKFNIRDEKEYIAIEMISDANILLPHFKPHTMYNGIKTGIKYTLEDLGI